MAFRQSIPARSRFSERHGARRRPSVFSPDKGKLRIAINGQQVGSEDFEISPSGDSWIERSSMTAHAPGGGGNQGHGQLRLSADGAPIHYDWSAEAQKKATGSVDFAERNGKMLGATWAALAARERF